MNRRWTPRKSGRWLCAGWLWSGLAALGADEATPAKKADAAEPKKEEGASEETRNWLDLSTGGVLLRGDKGQFQRRYQTSRDAFGGVESFHYEQDITKKGILKLDGRGLFDAHDYLLKVEVSNPDVGYFRAGYRQFRTWSDSTAGFFPRTGAWLPPADSALAVDRGEVWLETGLTLPNKPQVAFEYRHTFRDGQLDSLSWGDAGVPGPYTLRGIAPAFRQIDEAADIFAGDVKHKIGKTDFGVGLRYEIRTVDDSLNVQRRPDYRPPVYFNARLTDRQRVETDMLSGHAFTETRFNEKTLLTSGFSFTTLDTDLSGSRVYGPDFDSVYDPNLRVPPRYYGLTNLLGGSAMNQYVFNLNLMFNPWEHVTVVPAFRVEKNELEGNASFTLTPMSGEDVAAVSDRAFLDVSESLEVRYTAVTHCVFYGQGYFVQGNGDLNQRELASSLSLFRFTDHTQFDRTTQKYTLGADWYPSRKVTLGAQYYHKVRNNDYSHETASPAGLGRYPAGRYPGYLTANDFDTDDFNWRLTWRPRPNLSLVWRNDFQWTTIDAATVDLATVRSADQSSYIISQSATWSPWARLYLQGTFNYVLDASETPAAGVPGATDLVQNALNDYWNTTVTSGYALDDKTDLQTTYSYYRANNFADNSLSSQPYGADAEEHNVTAAIIHRLRKHLTCTLKYGFFKGMDHTYGGHNSYEAHLIYSSWQYRF